MSGFEGVIYKRSVFYPRSAAELTEEHYERLFLQHAGTWMPDWTVVPFKKTVVSELYQRAACPDLAIVHSDLLNWYIVEIELTTHSLASHVLPQVITLKDAYYSKEHAHYLIKKTGDTFAGRSGEFVRLITSIQPEIYVVAESEGPSWRSRVEAEGCRFLLFQPFRDDRGRWCYRFEGQLPSVEKRLLSYCGAARQFKMLNCLQVENHEAIPPKPRDRYIIHFDGVAYSWKIVRLAATAFLMAMDSFPYDLTGNRWALWLVDGQLFLERTPARRPGDRL